MTIPHRRPKISVLGALSLGLLLIGVEPTFGQTFDSGSTGANGAFAPTADTTLVLPPDGIFNFTTIDVPPGVTVTFTPNAANTAVTLLATGEVTINGTIDVDGQPGIPGATTGPAVNPGGAGGPGGFRGGQGGPRTSDNTIPPSVGQGPGGGGLPQFPPPQFGGGGVGGTYGAPAAFTSLIPLFGGSGGGGQRGSSTSSGSSGGGGGGAILIASSTKITLTGTVFARGGGGGSQSGLTVLTAGGGSGGAIRLVASEITGTGTLNVQQGIPFGIGPGRVRLEAPSQGLSFTGTVFPTNVVLVTSVLPGPVTPASSPALINLPTLRISSVGGVIVPQDPQGVHTTADISIPQGTANPVPVTVTATNTPVPATFTIKLIPQFADATSYTAVSSTQTGTFASSTATANVTFPAGSVSVLNAFAEFDLPARVAALLPTMDGVLADRMMVTAAHDGSSTVSLWMVSGAQVPIDDLSVTDRLRIARALALASVTER